MSLFDDPRATWGAAANTNPTPVAPGARLGVSWHYPGGTNTITPASDHQRCLNQVLAWQRFHMAPAPTGHGWADIGYNGLICMHARAIEGRGADLKGAHSPGVNLEHYGIQFMVSGTDLPTPAMLARAVVLNAALEARSGHTLRQWGHKDDPAASTDCPGPAIEAWVHSGGPYASAPTPPPATPPGGLTVADINTLTAQLNALQNAVDGFRAEEAGRYRTASDRYDVETGRYGHLVSLIGDVAAHAGVTIDAAALGGAIAAQIGEQVSGALTAELANLVQSLPAGATPDQIRAATEAAVRTVLGGLDNPPAVTP